eukprot:g37333.t1
MLESPLRAYHNQESLTLLPGQATASPDPAPSALLCDVTYSTVADRKRMKKKKEDKKGQFRGGTVPQWLALLPHSTRNPGLIAPL